MGVRRVPRAVPTAVSAPALPRNAYCVCTLPLAAGFLVQNLLAPGAPTRGSDSAGNLRFGLRSPGYRIPGLFKSLFSSSLALMSAVIFAPPLMVRRKTPFGDGSRGQIAGFSGAGGGATAFVTVTVTMPVLRSNERSITPLAASSFQ